jgi:hypothetical protein
MPWAWIEMIGLWNGEILQTIGDRFRAGALAILPESNQHPDGSVQYQTLGGRETRVSGTNSRATIDNAANGGAGDSDEEWRLVHEVGRRRILQTSVDRPSTHPECLASSLRADIQQSIQGDMWTFGRQEH